MRVFRDGAFRESPGLGAWWAEFAAASPALAMVAERRPDVQEALDGLVHDAGTGLEVGADARGGNARAPRAPCPDYQPGAAPGRPGAGHQRAPRAGGAGRSGWSVASGWAGGQSRVPGICGGASRLSAPG